MSTPQTTEPSASASSQLELFTVEQAAQYLQLSTSTIRVYIRGGKLKAFRAAGIRKMLIKRSDILLLLQPAKHEQGVVPTENL
jgi:excisionase family DNA binding protein